MATHKGLQTFHSVFINEKHDRKHRAFIVVIHNTFYTVTVSIYIYFFINCFYISAAGPSKNMLTSPQVKLFLHGNKGEDSPDEGQIKVKSLSFPSEKPRFLLRVS